MNSLKTSLLLVTAIFSLSTTTISMAKIINLYDQPKTDAKVIGTLDSTVGMVPIFTPKESDWMKVGDPKNGDVGWIKTADLADNNGSLSTAMSVTQKTVNSSNGPKTYQVVKLGTPKTMSPEEKQALLLKIQTQQREMEQAAQKMLGEFYQNMNKIYQENPDLLNNITSGFPVFVPVMLVPAPQAAVTHGPVLNSPAIKSAASKP